MNILLLSNNSWNRANVDIYHTANFITSRIDGIIVVIYYDSWWNHNYNAIKNENKY
jgi:hypothetical protein